MLTGYRLLPNLARQNFDLAAEPLSPNLPGAAPQRKLDQGNGPETRAPAGPAMTLGNMRKLGGIGRAGRPIGSMSRTLTHQQRLG
jgi:hypothetical protein